jgi:hypothetical protein
LLLAPIQNPPEFADQRNQNDNGYSRATVDAVLLEALRRMRAPERPPDIDRYKFLPDMTQRDEMGRRLAWFYDINFFGRFALSSWHSYTNLSRNPAYIVNALLATGDPRYSVNSGTIDLDAAMNSSFNVVATEEDHEWDLGYWQAENNTFVHTLLFNVRPYILKYALETEGVDFEAKNNVTFYDGDQIIRNDAKYNVREWAKALTERPFTEFYDEGGEDGEDLFWSFANPSDSEARRADATMQHKMIVDHMRHNYMEVDSDEDMVISPEDLDFFSDKGGAKVSDVRLDMHVIMNETYDDAGALRTRLLMNYTTQLYEGAKGSERKIREDYRNRGSAIFVGPPGMEKMVERTTRNGRVIRVG